VDIGRELLHKFKSLRLMSGVDASEFNKTKRVKPTLLTDFFILNPFQIAMALSFML
jgi:hypothetical protein